MEIIWTRMERESSWKLTCEWRTSMAYDSGSPEPPVPSRVSCQLPRAPDPSRVWRPWIPSTAGSLASVGVTPRLGLSRRMDAGDKWAKHRSLCSFVS